MIRDLFKRTVVVFVAIVGIIYCGSFYRMTAADNGLLPLPKDGTEVNSVLPKEITTSTGIELVLIPAGEFIMGNNSRPGQRDAFNAPHSVTISEPFYLGKYPVTQRQWKEIMGNNPSRFADNPDKPVENVTWTAVREFIRRMNEKEHTDRYRFPTDAEWEYAGRAGTKTRYFWGDWGNVGTELDKYVWHNGNSGGSTQPVGIKPPNPWNLYDMLGNVDEWVYDWYSRHDSIEYSLATQKVDPKGPESNEGDVRILRGGSWDRNRNHIDIHTRVPDAHYLIRPVDGTVGFRLAASAN